MSQFLRRNKKKGALAGLLMFFKRGKGVGPLILMVVMLSFIFIAPSSMLMSIPFVGAVAQKLGLRSDLGGGNLSTRSLEEALRIARQKRRGLHTPGALFGKDGVKSSSRYGKSTVDFVKGRETLPGSAQTYDDIADVSGKSVDGVLRPEDSKKIDDGVALDNEDLVNGLMNPAYADVIGGAGGNKAAFENLKGYGGGFGNANSGARPLDRSADLVSRSIDEKTQVPNVGRPRNLGGGGGKLSKRGFRKLSARVSGALGNARGSGRNTAMYQLAEGRAYSIAAAPPPGKCDPNDCPNEYARNISGAVFDGSKVKGGILTAEEFGDPPTPNIPSQGDIGNMIGEAEQIEADAEACEQANDTYGPQMDESNAKIQKLSDKLNSMNCNSGGCSKSKAKKCQAVGDQMRAECENSNKISQKWANACPMTNGNYNKQNCNQ